MNKDEATFRLSKKESDVITINAHIAREVSPPLDDPGQLT
jgi:hypothetical protein